MSTALQIIQSSLRKIGVIASGETLSSEESSDALGTLNQMLGDWNNQKLIMLGITIEEFSLVAGQNSYTLGSGGDFDTSIPIETDKAFITYSDNNEKPIEIIDNAKWGRIVDKTVQSTIADYIYIERNYPLQTVYVYPTPSEVKTLTLHNRRKLSSISSLTTSFSLPDGYERAIIYNLAIELAPEYGKSSSAEIFKIASESLSNIKRSNLITREIGVDEALVSRGGFDWRTG